MVKTIVLLLDGLGDRPQNELDGRTPLEAANTPNLDKLCQQAETGMMIPWRQGVPLGTEVAHFILFGYDMKDFPGRGIINALSRNFSLEEDAVYMVTSWAYVEEREGLFIKERWTKDLSIEEVTALKEALPNKIEDITLQWDYSIGPHGVLKLKGDAVSSEISDSDPFYDHGHVIEIEAFETNCSNARYTAKVLNRYLRESYTFFKHHPINLDRAHKGKQPANFLLTKWAGRKPNLVPFEEKHGMKGCIVGSSQLMLGISKLLGMDYIHYKNFKEGVDLAINSDYEFIHLHTKAPDEAAHTKNPHNKVKVLEEIDSYLKPLVDAALKENLLLVVTGDHTTPSSGEMIHSGEPLPIMFIGKNVRVDDVKTFGERSCSKGNIRMEGCDLIQMVLNLTERALFYNFRPGARRLNHIPKTIKKFKL
ncbi:MAG: 2,3-bisphosphoglycerate-independent phosphoglycerate mutase [Clostridiaceae bacterium]|nr:2,3-bisphosphoglycerate-independent phosphoglycerate mutase [Clostridiaceae bacterium]